jgi:hypothetical protein
MKIMPPGIFAHQNRFSRFFTLMHCEEFLPLRKDP